MHDQCPHKLWSTLKSAVFGSSSDSSLLPLIGAGGGLVCESVGKAEILSANFDGKQSRDPADLPYTQVTVGETAPAGSIFLWRH